MSCGTKHEFLSGHYSDLGGNTEDFKSSPHNINVNAHVKFLKEIFKCIPEHNVLDLAAGNCIFAKRFISEVDIKLPILCVEPYEEMLKHGENDERIKTLCMGALEFSTQNHVHFDRILIRMAMHHFGNENLSKIFKGLYNSLNDGGMLVIIRMHSCDNLPWFNKLKDVFNTPDPTHLSDDVILDMLKQSGFQSNKKLFKSSRHSITKENLFKSFRIRYVSTLSKLTDNEIEEGIVELKKKYEENNEIEFFEEFDFFVAEKI